MTIAARVIVADPPWPMAWRGGTTRKNGRGERYAPKVRAHTTLPYPTMTVDAIERLNVISIGRRDAVLFLWAPDVFILDGTAARVCRRWGFIPQRFFVWAKRGYGLGTFPRPQHELAVFAKRGIHRPGRRDVGSVGAWKFPYKNAARHHSAKPPEFLALIETVYPGPYVELFARSALAGWLQWGNEIASDEPLTRLLGSPGGRTALGMSGFCRLALRARLPPFRRANSLSRRS